MRRILKESLSPRRNVLVAGSGGVAGILTFVLSALPAADGPAACFAAALLALVVAAVSGPFLFTRRPGERGWAPAARAAVRSFLLGLLAALACGAVALLREGPLGAALAVGFFAGLYALALGALSDLLRSGPVRVAVAVAGLLGLATLFFWDEQFLLDATDRNASAAVAYRLNAAAAVARTLGFDWIHAKALYTDNQTAERMFAVRQTGIGPMSLWLGGLALMGVGLGLPRGRG